MPLRLKSLELHGYKTFAAKTVFEFAAGVTAIVGPNGSGKSNIADAIRWVLGEQSYGLLRAKKTEDMIFAGSEQRPRAGMASATILFDNSDNWLPVDFSEVALTRRAYRDGRNEYLLNGQQVRLKDINELLAQSGLAERTYTILGQGLVDASLALKADERRRLFEEAAGIGLYRARREETLRRLETTRRNLDRVLDILAELEPRLKSLERQARRAREYAQIRADLELLLRDWYGYHWHRAQREFHQAQEMARRQEERLQQARQEYQHISNEMGRFRAHLTTLRARLNEWRRQSALLHNRRERIGRDLAVLDERQRALQEMLRQTAGQRALVEKEWQLAQERLAESEGEVARLQAEDEEAQRQRQSAQEQYQRRLRERADVEQNLQRERRRWDEVHSARLQAQARLEELQRHLETRQQKLSAIDAAIAGAEEEQRQAEKDYQVAVQARQKAEAAHRQGEQACQEARQRLNELEARRRECLAERAQKDAERARLQAQLEVLEQAERSLTGYAEGTRLLLKAGEKRQLPGARGALSALLEMPAALETAIAAALGEYLDAIVLASNQDAERALLLLEENPGGRAALLPLDTLRPLKLLTAPPQAGCLGVAAALVQEPPELRSVVDLLLGQTLIVEDRAAARRILTGLPSSARAVTVRGEVFSAAGPVLAGTPQGAPSLARSRQRRELQESLSRLGEELAALEETLRRKDGESERARQRLEAIEKDVAEKRRAVETAIAAERQTQVRLESARRRREWEKSRKAELEQEQRRAQQEQETAARALSQSATQLEEVEQRLRALTGTLAALALDELQHAVSHWSTRAAVVERALRDARARREEQRQALRRLEEQKDLLERRGKETEEALMALAAERESLRGQEAETQTQLEAVRQLLEPAEREVENAEAQEAAIQSRLSSAQQALSLMEHQYNQVQLEVERKREALESLRKKIEDDFGLVEFKYLDSISGPLPLPFEGMVQQLPTLTELPPDLEENLNRQRGLLRRLGPVNPEAEQEYESLQERYGFLQAQLQDLREAETDLRQVIAELDERTRREFQRTFEAVAEEFHTIFRRLFGGGAARVVLTDPADLTTTGIDIEARLPGRREQGLALLSGGERSLTAIALVFALLKVSPTPLCVLDEVDAMLDEANVGRFREMLVELSQKTQFIVITHNRNTVQAADVIYGVTMSRDSTSQVISLRLDEVSEKYLHNG